MRITIGKKIGLGYGVGFFCLLIIGAVSFNSIGKLINNAVWVDHTHEVLYDLSGFLSFLQDVETGQRGFIITGEEKYLESYNVALENISKSIDVLKEKTKTVPRQQERITRLGPLVSEKLAFSKEAIDLRKEKGIEAAVQVVMTDKGKKVMDDMRKIIAEMVTEENDLLQKRSEDSKTAEKNAKNTIIFGTFIAAALVSIVGFGISRSLKMKLAIVNNIAQAAGTGDLTATVPALSDDEIGDLGQGFNKMIIALKNIITQVLGVSERVSSSSQQLSSSAEEMNATSEEVSSTVQQIAKGSANTALRVEETSKVMEQMNTSVNQVAASSQQAASAAAQARQSAQKGGEAAKEAVDKMVKIFESSNAVSEAIKKLDQRSDQINEIVKVITDISDQTNLLALNAAIEAARAGEAGRGFAVVAEEVRKLAEGSSKAADQIAKLIKEVQKDTTQAVQEMATGSKVVNEGRQTIIKTGQALDEIVKAAENNASMVEQISTACEQMSAGTKQVVKSIDDIAATAEESASATEEAGASTEEMTASMNQMATSAQELSEMAVSLRDLVGKFKVSGSENVLKPEVAHKEGKSPVRQKSALAEKLEANRKKIEESRKARLCRHDEGDSEEKKG